MSRTDDTTAEISTDRERPARNVGQDRPETLDIPTPPSEDQLPAWVHRGVLMYGPRKGGTTLFQNLLDGGEHVFVYPTELKLKWFAVRPGQQNDLDTYLERSLVPTLDSPHLSRARYRGLWAAIAEHCRPVDLGALIRYDAWATHASCRNVPATPRLWCAKDVGGDPATVIAAWRRVFPGAKVLMIVREPLMVVRAVMTDRRRRSIRLTLGQIARETLDAMRLVAAQARLPGEPNLLAVAYEDLVADPEGVMTRVAAHLGIPPSRVHRRPTLLAEPVVVKTASRPTTTVFRSAASWTDGLTLREKTVIAVVSALAGLLPRYRVDYAALRRRLQGDRPGAAAP